MRNITGTPTEGDDFFDRQRDLDRFVREIHNDANLLLSTPRRVGKTSLVLRLCELLRQQGFAATFFNVEGCDDELAFGEMLVDGLQKEGLQPQLIPKLAEGLRRFRKALGRVSVGAGVNVEIDGVPDLEYGTLSKLLESIFQRIEEGDKRVVIAVDELPELLLALTRREHGPQRVEHLLHWLRAMRQTYRRRVRWIFLGSIGLDGFVDDRQLRKTINDLTSIGLDAFTPDEAQGFLEKLGRDNGLPLAQEARLLILQKIGWPLPYHLQLVFHSLRDLGCPEATTVEVERAVANLLLPENLSHFDTWRQRLDEQFTRPDATAAKRILTHLSLHPEGRTRQQIFDALMAAPPAADPITVEEQLAKLLLVLQRDGYLLENAGNYAFRSFLLREYWHRREIR